MNLLFQLQPFPSLVQLLFFFLFYFIGNVFVLMYLQLLPILGVTADSSASVLNMMTATQIFGFLLPSILFIKLIPKNLGEFLLLKPIDRKVDYLWLLLLSLAVILAVSGLAQLLQYSSWGTTADELQKNRKDLENNVLNMRHWSQLPSRLFVMALLPAICEEIFFRGVLQRIIFSATKGRNMLLSIGFTAIIFASLHGSLYNMLPIALAGIILGWIYYSSGNIWYNVILHFLINGTQIIITYFQDKEEMLENEQILYAVLFLILGIIGITAILKNISKYKKSKTAEWLIPNAVTE
jgi:membrane protease YdiL (CAAX protease family)